MILGEGDQDDNESEDEGQSKKTTTFWTTVKAVQAAKESNRKGNVP